MPRDRGIGKVYRKLAVKKMSFLIPNYSQIWIKFCLIVLTEKMGTLNLKIFVPVFLEGISE